MPRTSTLRTVAFAAGAGVALLLPALGAASSLAAPPAPASAAASAIAPPTVGTLVSAPENSALSVTARVGKANVLAIALSNTTFTVRDTGDTVKPGVNCTSVDAHTVRCTAFANGVRINTGDLDDVVNAPLPLAVNVNAGAGNDRVSTGTGDDTLSGSDGNDVLRGGFGADRIDGGRGDNQWFGDGGRDTVVAGGTVNGADVMFGGAGSDVVTYSGRTARVVVTLDDVANDGEANERDNVRSDIEEVTGGRGNDALTGSNVATVTNLLVGGDGADTLTGLAGKDRMFGGNGNDVLSGGAGRDELDGGLGADTFLGGPDTDEVSYSGRTGQVGVTLDNRRNDGERLEDDDVRSDVEDITGGSGPDVLIGSSGANVLIGGSGNDYLDGGTGDDDFFGGCRLRPGQLPGARAGPFWPTSAVGPTARAARRTSSTEMSRASPAAAPTTCSRATSTTTN